MVTKHILTGPKVSAGEADLQQKEGKLPGYPVDPYQGHSDQFLGSCKWSHSGISSLGTFAAWAAASFTSTNTKLEAMGDKITKYS